MRKRARSRPGDISFAHTASRSPVSPDSDASSPAVAWSFSASAPMRYCPARSESRKSNTANAVCLSAMCNLQRNDDGANNVRVDDAPGRGPLRGAPSTGPIGSTVPRVCGSTGLRLHGSTGSRVPGMEKALRRGRGWRRAWGFTRRPGHGSRKALCPFPACEVNGGRPGRHRTTRPERHGVTCPRSRPCGGRNPVRGGACGTRAGSRRRAAPPGRRRQGRARPCRWRPTAWHGIRSSRRCCW